MQSFLGRRGDSYDRFLIRIREMYESISIVFQVLSNLTNSHKLAASSNSKDAEFMTFFQFFVQGQKKSVK
jgi:NADH:ubiquinone oxidoreductase subunit D